MADATTIADKQFAAVALRQRELGNALVGQRIVVIAYLNLFRVHNKSTAKVRKLIQNTK